jgi:mannose-6-phosphate isomerase-like protein (cupin superfamily)
MAHAASSNNQHAALLAERLVRYEDLRPCLTAFIDTRTPGSKKKENFTIIGPGVAENPDQHVHIDIPHGFNIGGARQPPGCINSQHSHETAEVFVVHSGTWAFLLGPNKEDGRVVLGPGDTISIPVHVFRGFENVGDDLGFLFAVLGGDDPGHVTWAPYVFDDAAQYGLVLLEDGSLVDTTKGEEIPDGKRAMQPTTEDDLARFDRLTAEDMAGCVFSHERLQAQASSDSGIREYPIIGGASPAEGLAAGQMEWPHGFHVRYVHIDPRSDGEQHVRHEEEVIMMFQGRMTVALPSGEVDIGSGDVLTVPIGMPRQFSNRSEEAIEAYFVRGGNNPRPPTLVS